MFVYRLEVFDYDGDWCGPFSGERVDKFDKMTSRALRSYVDDFHHCPPPSRAYYQDEITGTFGLEGLIYWFPNLEDYIKEGARVMCYEVQGVTYMDNEQVTFVASNGTSHDVTQEVIRNL